MQQREPGDHRRNYVLALPAVGLLGGAYLLLDGVVDIPTDVLLLAVGTALLLLTLLELAFMVTDWLQKYEKQSTSESTDRREKG